MKKSIDHYISELLYTNDCVIIPGFGGFVGNPIPANLDEENQILSPPSKQILFNKNLKTNDGLLIHYIANQEDLNQKEVKKEIEKFTEEISRKLKKIKNFRLEKIGLLSINNDNNLIFNQDTNINYSLESYGMSHIISQRILHESIEKEIKKDFKSIIQERNTISYRKVWRAAAILLPLLGLSLISITQQDNITSIYTEMAKLSPFKHTSSTITIEKKIPIKNIVIKNTKKDVLKKEVEDPVKKKIIKPATEEYYQYHVVAGAFGSQSNADKLILKLQKQNYNAKIIGNSSSGLIRVSYSSYKTKEEAVIALATIRKQNSSAWILSQ